MDWLEVITHTTTAGSEPVSDLMISFGAAGTQVEDRADVPDPSKPHGYWEIIDPDMIEKMPKDVLVHAWYQPDAFSGESLAALRQRLETLRGSLGEAAGSLEVETVNVRDEDWSEVWKQFYKPFRAGRTLVVKPVWEAYTPEPGDRVIEMDPGMAFGNGTHETTGLCLALLEDAVKEGDRVIDVGTGSGILAIGAARLGARRVLAIDIDPDAVRVARENVARNGLTDRIDCVKGDLLQKRDETCEVCVANIIADVIIAFAQPLTQHIVPGGLFVCSGIIKEREQDVLAALAAANYTVLRVERRGEWVAMLSRRSA